MEGYGIGSVPEESSAGIVIPKGWKRCRIKGLPVERITHEYAELREVIRNKNGGSSVRIVKDGGEDIIYFNPDETVGPYCHPIYLATFRRVLLELQQKYPGIKIEFSE